MADLLKDYFKRDLSEAELDKLEAMLEDEAKALALLRMAKRRYAATGLPDPLHRPGFWERFRFRPGRALGAALATLLLVVLLPVALRQPKRPELVAPAALEKKAPSGTRARRRELPLAKKSLDRASSAKAAAQVMAEPELPAAQAGAAPAPAAMMAPPPPAASADAMAYRSQVPESRLKRKAMAAAVAMPLPVSLRLEKASPGAWIFEASLAKGSYALARILDEQQQARRTLWDADMEPGITALNWDGKDSLGLALPAGHYVLELKTDTNKADLDINLP